MTVLDAYALIAFLVGGPAAPRVRSILREGDAGVAAVNLVETFDVAQRVHGIPIERVDEILEPLTDALLATIPLDARFARRAASIRATHYHRSARPISLADAVLLASATSSDRIATSDPDVLAVAEAEGIQTIRLPEQG